MKKSKSFIVVLLVTVILAVGVMIPAVEKTKMNLGLGMGRDTTLVFSAKNKDTTKSVDYATLKKIFTNRADYFKTSQYSLSLSDSGDISITVPSRSEVAFIQSLMSETMNFEVRDVKDNLLLSADDLSNATVIYNSSGSVLIQFTFNQEALQAASNKVMAYATSDERYFVIWTNYTTGDTYSAQKTIADNSGTPKYLSTALVSAENTTGLFTIAGITSETYSKQLAGMINAGSANYTYTLVSSDSVGSYASLDRAAYIIGYGALAVLAVLALFNFKRYKQAAVGMLAGIGITHSLTLCAFVFAGGSVSVQALIGLWVSVAVLLLTHFYAIKRAKLAVIKGRGVEASVRSGYDAIIRPSLLADVLLFAVGLVVYLVNVHFLRDFGMMLVLGALLNATFGLFWTRMIIITGARSARGDVSFIGINAKDNTADAQDGLIAKENRLSTLKNRKSFAIVLIASLAIVAVFGVLALTNKNIMIPDYQRKLIMVVNKTDETTQKTIADQLSAKGIESSSYTISTGDSTTYTFNGVAAKDTLNSMKLDLATQTEASVNVFDFVSIDKTNSSIELAIIVGTVLLTALILLCFYSFKFAQVGFMTALLNGLVVIAVSGYFGLSVSGILMGFLATLLSLTISFLVFSNIREDMKANKRLRTNKEVFDQLVLESFANNADLLINVILGLLLFGVLFIGISTSNLALVLISMVAVVVSLFVLTVFFEPSFMVAVIDLKPESKTKANHKSNDKKNKSDKEELTVLGVND